MSQYSRRQEDRAEQKLKDIGFELIEDTGRRSKGKADRIMRHVDTGIVLCVDHKSTQGRKTTTLGLEQLDKVENEARRYGKGAVPALTFSYKGVQEIYIAFPISKLEGIMY